MDAPAAIAGWDGAMYTRTTDADERCRTDMMVDTVIRYDNMADPTDEAYDEYFSTGAATGRDGVANSANAAEGVLTLSNDQTGNHERFSTAFGITAAHQTVPITHDDPGTMDVVEDRIRIHGYVLRRCGHLHVHERMCSVESDDMGNLFMLNGTWTFAPTVAEDGNDR